MKPIRISVIFLAATLSACQTTKQSRSIAKLSHTDAAVAPTTFPKHVRHRAAADEHNRDRNRSIKINIENEFSRWTPRPYDREVPTAAIRDPQIEVEGHWMIDSPYDHSTMQLSLLPSKHYSVEIHSRGCGLDWELRRTAVFHDGILLFDRPAEVAGLGSFDRLFAVRLDSRPCLLPPRHAACVNNELDASGEITANSGIIERCTFGRSGERLTYADRYEFHAAP